MHSYTTWASVAGVIVARETPFCTIRSNILGLAFRSARSSSEALLMKVIDSLTPWSATSSMVATSQADSGHPVARKTLTVQQDLESADVFAGNNVPTLYRPRNICCSRSCWLCTGNLWSLSPSNNCGLVQTSAALVTMLQNSFLGPPTLAASSSYSPSISEEKYATSFLWSFNLGFL